MKLIVEIDMPEAEIQKLIEGMPPWWFEDPDDHPIIPIALALKKAFEKAKSR